MNEVLELYKTSGNEAFTYLVTEYAPYFKTINPVFNEVRPHYAEASFPNTREVQNHLGTVHAIAMCNAAELVAGTMTEVSISEELRWIPKAMSVKYLAKARTDLRAVADGSNIKLDEEGEVEVPVTVYDTDEQIVFTASITMKISKKREKKKGEQVCH
ncbi:hotdog fold domain-containing protein [Desulfobacter curvatus]|uniref:hotdog fold domain-containing protein n=1 Tax=Desulfobacter curvatus TaxID=2290 RepID=UPI0003828C28|nr:hotdog fold domain-containing protein [Desulfobacter curvatus]